MTAKRKSALDILFAEYDAQNCKEIGPRPKRAKIREIHLPIDVLRRICSYLTDARDFASFSSVSHDCLTATLLEKTKMFAKDGILDIKRAFFDNPFHPLVIKQLLHCRHNNLYVGYAQTIQRMDYLCDALESFMLSDDFVASVKEIRNFDLRSLQLFSNFCRCSDATVVPPELQKRLKKILKSFTSLERVAIPSALLKPKRFFQAIENKFSSLVSLDLQYVTPTDSINLVDAFIVAENLRDLTWYCADIETLTHLPAPHRLTRLRIKFLSSEVLTAGVDCAKALSLFQGVKELFVGIYIGEDDEENLNDLEEYFSCWWAKSAIYEPDEFEEREGFDPAQPYNGNDTDYLIQAFPKLTSLALQWVPNKLLSILQKRPEVSRRLKELSFGCADDLCESAYNAANLHKLQSIFTIAARKVSASDRILPSFQLKSLKFCVRFENTDVVSSHLHKIFDSVAVLFPHLRELGLVCRIPPRLGSDPLQKWFLFKPEQFQKMGALEKLKKMKIHLRCGDCHLAGLHDYIPNNVEDLAISIDYVHDGDPPSNADIVAFIDKIADVGRFENLQKLHFQVTGVQCFDQLIHVIPKLHSTLEELSILSPSYILKGENQIETMRSCLKNMKHLKVLKCSRSFLEQLFMSHHCYKETAKQNWRQALVNLGRELNVSRVEMGSLPEDLFDVQADHYAGCGQLSEWIFPCPVGDPETDITDEDFNSMLLQNKCNDMKEFLSKFDSFRRGESSKEAGKQRNQELVNAHEAHFFKESLEEYRAPEYSDESENSFVVGDEDDEVVYEESDNELENFERSLRKRERRKERRRAKKGLPKRRISISSSSSEEEVERDDDLVVNELHANPEPEEESDFSHNEMLDDEAEEGDPLSSEGEQESEVYFTDSEEEDADVEEEDEEQPKPTAKKRIIIESDEEDE